MQYCDYSTISDNSVHDELNISTGKKGFYSPGKPWKLIFASPGKRAL